MKHDIFIIDDLKPEDLAMLQALYSRSPASVMDHLPKVEARGSGNFMDQYYVGYGHKSIGDCGTTTIFIENVTMLCAKAIQDWPLYSGQEASTRYMDFSEVPFYNPACSAAGEAIQERWRSFYLEAREPLRQHLLEKYPRQEDEDEKVYATAIQARMFDVLRAFLPAGAATNLSWTTNLRQALDHLMWLSEHPAHDIQRVAWNILAECQRTYPHSFPEPIQTREQGNWRANMLENNYYVNPTELYGFGGFKQLVMFNPEFEQWSLGERMLAALKERPRGVEIPWYTAGFGLIRVDFNLDFGSFRDLQRHRNGTIHMPLLTTELGFHPWYLEELPVDLRERAQQLLFDQEVAIKMLYPDASGAFYKQNYIAMGYRVTCNVSQPLGAYVYRLELRSSKTVHPTLRQIVLEEISHFRNHFPDIALHVDEDPDHWTVRRGKQTITER